MPTAFRPDRFSHCEGCRIGPVTYYNCLGFDSDAAGEQLAQCGQASVGNGRAYVPGRPS